MTPTPPEKPKRTVLLKAEHVESFSNEYFSSESDEDEVPIITHIDKTTSISVKGSITIQLIDLYVVESLQLLINITVRSHQFTIKFNYKYDFHSMNFYSYFIQFDKIVF